jgi:biopolymer transport protein TolQ
MNSVLFLIDAAAQAATAISIIAVVKNSSLVVNIVLGGLVVLSVLCWGVIIFKFIQHRRAVIATEQFIELFWKNMDFQEVYRKSEKLQDSPIATVFRSGYTEFSDTKKSWESKGIHVVGSKVDELVANIERAMKREAQTRNQLLENSLTLLATTASSAPFIGLFGTVWGIMDAFHVIGITGNATLGTIAPAISEALIATAFGLAAAIPAAIFYNYFTSNMQKREGEATNITSDFLNSIKRSLV